jgi:hypothetical protein
VAFLSAFRSLAESACFLIVHCFCPTVTMSLPESMVDIDVAGSPIHFHENHVPPVLSSTGVICNRITTAITSLIPKVQWNPLWRKVVNQCIPSHLLLHILQLALIESSGSLSHTSANDRGGILRTFTTTHGFHVDASKAWSNDKRG